MSRWHCCVCVCVCVRYQHVTFWWRMWHVECAVISRRSQARSPRLWALLKSPTTLPSTSTAAVHSRLHTVTRTAGKAAWSSGLSRLVLLNTLMFSFISLCFHIGLADVSMPAGDDLDFYGVEGGAVTLKREKGGPVPTWAEPDFQKRAPLLYKSPKTHLPRGWMHSFGFILNWFI